MKEKIYKQYRAEILFAVATLLCTAITVYCILVLHLSEKTLVAIGCAVIALATVGFWIQKLEEAYPPSKIFTISWYSGFGLLTVAGIVSSIIAYHTDDKLVFYNIIIVLGVALITMFGYMMIIADTPKIDPMLKKVQKRTKNWKDFYTQGTDIPLSAHWVTILHQGNYLNRNEGLNKLRKATKKIGYLSPKELVFLRTLPGVINVIDMSARCETTNFQTRPGGTPIFHTYFFADADDIPIAQYTIVTPKQLQNLEILLFDRSKRRYVVIRWSPVRPDGDYPLRTWSAISK